MNKLFNLENNKLIICRPSRYDINSYQYSLDNTEEFHNLEWKKFRETLIFQLRTIYSISEINKIDLLIRDYQTFMLDFSSKEIEVFDYDKREIDKITINDVFKEKNFFIKNNKNKSLVNRELISKKFESLKKILNKQLTK